MGVVKGNNYGPVTRYRANLLKEGPQGPAGPAGASFGGITGSGLVHVTGGTVDGAASHGAVGQMLFSSGSDVLWESPAGDVSLTGNTFTVTGIQGHGVSSTAPTEGQFLIYGASAWAPTSLTGDVSASATTPGATTVTALQGRAVTTNAPATNNVLRWTGSAWDPGAISAAMLPNLSGDVTGAYNATVVGGIQGHSITLATGYLQWTGTAWTFGTGGSTVTWANDLAGSTNTSQTVVGIQGKGITLATGFLNYTGSAWVFSSAASLFTPGADIAGNGTSTATSQYVSSISYSSAAAGGTVAINGTGTTLQVAANNTGFSLSQATPTSDVATSAFTVQAQAAFATATANKTGAVLNLKSGAGAAGGNAGVVNIYSGTALQAQFDATNGIAFSNAFYPSADNTWTVGAATKRFTGMFVSGSVGYQVRHASTDTQPSAVLGDGSLSLGPGGSTAPSTRLFYPSSAHQLQIDDTANGNATLLVGGTSGNQISIASSSTTISVTGTGASAGTAASISIAPQATNAAANSSSGSINLNLYAAASGGTDGYVYINRGGSELIAFGEYPNTPGLGCIWLTGSITPNSSNWAFTGDTGSTYYNAPSSHQWRILNSNYLCLTANQLYPLAAGVALGAATANNYWNGVYSGSFIFPAAFASTASIQWSAAATANGNLLNIKGQDAGGTSGTGGGLVFYPGRVTNGSGTLFANPAFEMMQITPNSGGNTSNTQYNGMIRKWANIRISDTAAHIVDSQTLSTSGNTQQSVGVRVKVMSRCVTAGISGGFTAVGQSVYSEWISDASYYTSSLTVGAMHQVGTTTGAVTVSLTGGGSTVSVNITVSNSGGSVVDVQVYTEWFIC